MKALEQMHKLVDLLLDFDANEDQPISKRVDLYSLILQMKDNQEIYGNVKYIVLEIYNKIRDGNQIDFGLVSAELCLYLDYERTRE
jgi:hypothetical protein